MSIWTQSEIYGYLDVVSIARLARISSTFHELQLQLREVRLGLRSISYFYGSDGSIRTAIGKRKPDQ